jgi:hypothetical protein
LKREDKSVDDMHDRIDKVESTGTDPNADNKYGLDKYDDQYYLDIRSEPPRFAYYRHVRAEKWEAAAHGPSEYDSTFTQDELDYALKREIRKTPEVRYQEEKANFLFHDLSCYMRDLGEEDYGCTGAGCIPECKYYPEYGRIEDDEVIEQHNKLVEELRQQNKIVEPPSEAELQRLAKIYLFE